ncbi:MAG TPA: lysine biosynthesis protein LysW [Planctomycetota bacterium]
MAKAECPVCELEFPLERNSVVGEILECPDCGAELELTRVDPVRVELAPEVDEDWGE